MRSSSIFALSAAAVLCLSAGGASAATYALNLQPTGANPTVWTAGIYSALSNSTGASSKFTDYFTFKDPTPGNETGGGNANAISLSASGPITFSNISLIDQSTNSLVQSGTVYSDNSGNWFANLFSFVLGSKSDTYAIQVDGNIGGISGSTTTGNYSGNFNISAVPEPKTYAMLLAGLGLLAFTARRRKANFF